MPDENKRLDGAAAAAIEAEARRLAAEWLAMSTLATLIEAAPDRVAAVKALVDRQMAHLRVLQQHGEANAKGDAVATALLIATSERFADLLKKAISLAAESTFAETTAGTRN